MSKRILFLDDSPGRHKDFLRWAIGNPVDQAWTAQEAIALLSARAYDVVFLDHDLGGKEMVASDGHEETGYTVAKWMVANKPVVGLVVVHSLNPGGRDNIRHLLQYHNYNVVVAPFIGLNADNINRILTLDE